MRRLPELRFFYDEGADHRAQIDAVLDEIRAEDEARRQAFEGHGEADAPAHKSASASAFGDDESN
jgi:regulator of protease activity HflC (stomatin/prohibitin superfamily)